jgi:hypothetical protein
VCALNAIVNKRNPYQPIELSAPRDNALNLVLTGFGIKRPELLLKFSVLLFSSGQSGEKGRKMVKWKSEITIVVVSVLLLAISAAPYIDSVEEEVVAAADDDSIRLPTSVIPIHYDLALVTTVHTGTRAFSGNVRIRVQVVTATNSITLHNRGLSIDRVVLTNVASGNAVVNTFSLDTTRDFLIIDTDEVTLTQGAEYLLEIEYTGNLRTDMGGFYRSQYFVDGETLPRYNHHRLDNLFP